MKLNLGSGSGRKADFISVDLYHQDADLKHDISQPFPYTDGSIEEIYSSHAIEHLTRHQWARAREIWFKLLKPGGKIELGCPDFEECLKMFLADATERRWEWWIKTIYGSQDEDNQIGQVHKNGFTLDKLASDLKEVGFKIIEQEKTADQGLHIIAEKPS